MFRCLPGLLPFALHGLTDREFRRRHKDVFCWLSGVGVRAGGFLGGLVGPFVAWHADVCWDPAELDVPVQGAELVEGTQDLGQNILSRRAFGVLGRPEGSLIVGEDGARPRAVAGLVNVE